MVTHLVSTGGVKQVPAENPPGGAKETSRFGRGRQIEVPFSSMNLWFGAETPNL